MDPTIARRHFLRGGAVVFALAVTGAWERLDALAAPRGLAHASLDTLRGEIGTTLRVKAESGATCNARLVDVVRHGRPSADTPFEQFSLVLEIDGDLEQGVHVFEHPRHGSSHLLSVPVLRDRPDHPSHARYVHEISFSRPA